VSISLEEVRHIASLARLGISDERARRIAVELNGILEHMQVLAAADTTSAGVQDLWSPGRMPLRADQGPPIALMRALTDIAPEMRDGFFLVPRLATHEDSEP
jgi:aspartyl-tRNA(Asn)/glutamyl-tRNA(Gln) amidotransferase subunit C